MRLAVRFVIILTLLVGLVPPAFAREEIRSFLSDVILNTDGSVSVTETLVVNAEGDEIRRGIYRDIPVVMQDAFGAKIRPDLEVVAVQRDGTPEMFRVERMGSFQRIWIGNPDEFISFEEHTYTIRYTLSRMVRSFEDHDELYWNATGNYWIFPILEARANVILPDGAVISRVVAYQGDVGSTDTSAVATRISDTGASFAASRMLEPAEGLTFAVAFNKGVISFPEGVDALAQQLGDLRDVFLPLLAALLVIAYNAIAWWRVGRDPQKGTIIPLFHPPKGFSPALTHYVHRWGFDNSGWPALTAAIFDLGVKGLVTIDTVGENLRVSTTGQQPKEALSTGERIIFDYFRERQTTLIAKANGPELAKRRTEFTSAIARENRTRWFRNNVGYSVLGIFLAAAMLAALVWTGVLDVVWLIASVIAGGVLATVGGLIAGAFQVKSLVRVVWFIFAGIVLFNGFGFALESFTAITINVAAIAAMSIVAVTGIFAVLMRAPTVQGRKVMDEIEGLKLYMDTAEKERMNMAAEPPMTISRFERLLPYAIALGVEKPWSEHFEAELARNGVADAQGGSYAPHWYRGHGGSVASASSMTNAVSAAAAMMTAAMVAAQPVQASSSGFSGGSGGGGFSGGGGGGGGGGGW